VPNYLLLSNKSIILSIWKITIAGLQQPISILLRLDTFDKSNAQHHFYLLPTPTPTSTDHSDQCQKEQVLCFIPSKNKDV
jgi:hypothetical protein